MLGQLPLGAVGKMCWSRCGETLAGGSVGTKTQERGGPVVCTRVRACVGGCSGSPEQWLSHVYQKLSRVGEDPGAWGRLWVPWGRRGGLAGPHHAGLQCRLRMVVKGAGTVGALLEVPPWAEGPWRLRPQGQHFRRIRRPGEGGGVGPGAPVITGTPGFTGLLLSASTALGAWDALATQGCAQGPGLVVSAQVSDGETEAQRLSHRARVTWLMSG